jgi:hypothetical protein
VRVCEAAEARVSLQSRTPELIPVRDKKSTLRIDSLKIYSKGYSLPHIKIYSKKEMRFLSEATNQRWSRFLHEATGVDAISTDIFNIELVYYFVTGETKLSAYECSV